MAEYSSQNPKPLPDGEQLEFELRLDNGKYIIRYFKSMKWQALRHGDDWQACPFPEWRPESNLEFRALFELAEARGWK